MCEFHLQAAFPGTRAAGEDIEDQLRSIDYLDPDFFLQIALLRRRKVLIEDDHVRGNGACQLRQLLHLARADQRRRRGPVQVLDRDFGDRRARRSSQFPQFLKRFLQRRTGGRTAAFPLEADQDRPF